MQSVDLRLPGLKLLKPDIFRDSRGFFLEAFRKSTYEAVGITCTFVQDNHSRSEHACIRGMHFQSFPGQAKLVRAAVGKIYDVVVDIRPDSATYGQWEAVILDDEHHHQLFIPVGFAHGFCVLSQEAHVLYKVSTPYEARYEKGFRWDDPTVNIAWPLPSPIISQRDQLAPFFQEITHLEEHVT